MIQCKRVYEPASPADGRRVLVDRLWPRGIRKEALAMDDWLKEVAPSNEVRKQFCHDPGKERARKQPGSSPTCYADRLS
ncbi:DUF488 domain-containing protein [Pseudomonas aeruginosa]|uniref:DUF488 domain-containing protein n=1 Tax=Pseudomonas aeruginosa TaxID=287 RepID=UPI0024419EC3|nr:DUF488 family protein [Pseudomonas aeruginosa]